MTDPAPCRRRLGLGRLCGVWRAQAGVAATEFAMIAPAFFVMIFGAFDISHMLYMKSVLEGAVQKASRDSTLQAAAGNDAAVRDAIDDAVRNQVIPINPDATITFDRKFYRTFTDAQAAEGEEIIDDANANGECDAGERFMDVNHDGFRNTDGGGNIDSAGARDNIVYTVTVEYREVFPLRAFIGGSPTTRLQATTVLANQPYGDQAVDGPPTPTDCA